MSPDNPKNDKQHSFLDGSDFGEQEGSQEETLIAAAIKADREPVAIIGIGCRFPGGANSPEAFWRLLRDGVDAITEVPPDRWNIDAFYDPDPTKPGKTYSRWGGFIDQIDQFDAQFFGISPREATRVDPQQRLLLEVAWEALEDGGQVPEYLVGSNTGVFIGISTHDYGLIQGGISERRFLNAYTTLGGTLSIAANRISYVFDFKGPSIPVDTACSSSLVAIHLACQSIWRGESALALAGGVNVLLRPEEFISFSKASMLSPDGRCKSFDAKADGFVRGEGAGIVVLKPLSKAVADADPIYAIIRSTAVNQDGHTNSITVPNASSQEAMLLEACRQAGVAPEQVQYVEAHGTGTSVGDPIEANALGKVLSHDRPLGDECLIGSVKSNIGHLEAASGIAGLIKVALCLKHGQIPPNLHYQTPNPKILFERFQLRVPKVLEPWPQNGRGSRLAGVNSFGFGGTNAHIVLEGVESLCGTSLLSSTELQDKTSPEDDRTLLLPLSGRSPEALSAVVQTYLDFFTNKASDASVSFTDICYNAGLRRAHHDHRLALVARSKAEAVEYLEAFLAGEPRLGLSSGLRIPGQSPQLVFVFSGMGPQWWAMGRQLLEQEPVFRESIEQCDALFQHHAGWSLWKELTADEKKSRINETQIAQPAIFSVQVALAALWRSWGVDPAAIVGHSVGEIAAAHVAGALSLEDAVRVVFHRSRLQAKTAGQGKMLAVGLSPEQAEPTLVGYEERVSIAAINSPNAVTLAGEADALEEIVDSLEPRGIFYRFLRVEVPYHSPKMEPLKAELGESLQGISPQSTAVPLFSTVTGQTVRGPELDATYWCQNIRCPVRFAAAMDSLMRANYDTFLELNAHPVLASSMVECLATAEKEGVVLPSLRRKESERKMMMGSLGKLYTIGYPIDWEQLYPEGGRFVRLPSYPWQRKHYWQESEESQQARRGGRRTHPILGDPLKSAHPMWNVEIDKQRLSYLDDHRVRGDVVYPGAAYVEMALAAAQATFGEESSCVVEEIELRQALFLSDGDPPTLQLILEPNQTSFDIYSRGKAAEQSWIRHATGKLVRSQKGNISRQVAVEKIRNRCANQISQDDWYREFGEIGLQYGPCFQGVERVWSGEGEALGQIRVPEELEAQLEDYWLHPAILDACFQVLRGTIYSAGQDDSEARSIYLPVQIDRVRFYNRPGNQLWSHAHLVGQSPSGLKGDIEILDNAGNLLVEIQGLYCQSVAGTREAVSAKMDDYLYEYQWELRALPGQKLVRQPGDYMPSLREISADIRSVTAHLGEQLGRKHYYETASSHLDDLSVAYVLDAFQQLGWRYQLRERFSEDALAEHLGIASQYQGLLSRMLEALLEEGMLGQVDGQWEVCQTPEVKDPQELWRTLIARHPGYQAELMLVRRCGQQLSEVLRGRVAPLQLILPEGSVTRLEHLYQDSPSFRVYNWLVRTAISTVLAHLPEERTIRILEIGGGTGGMTTYLLPLLPVDRTEYVFADVFQLFVAHAEQKFRAYPFVQCQLLDIETDPVAQGLEAHSFDLILVSNGLHMTGDLRRALENAKQLLASQGLLVLVELTNPSLWSDLVFGLLKEWWRFSDSDLRSSSPLLPWEKWKDLLAEVGFNEITAVLDTERADAAMQTIILAQGPSTQQTSRTVIPPQLDKSGSWLIFADSLGVGQQLAELLKECEETPILVSPGETYHCIDAGHFQICPEHPADMQRLLEAVRADQPDCRGVVHLWSLDILPPEKMTLASLEEAQTLSCISTLHLVQALAKADWSDLPCLWLVTRGTQAVGGLESISVAQHTLWGLGRVIINEHPGLCTHLVDLSLTSSYEEIRSLFGELWLDDQEDEIALRGEGRYVHRLKRVALASIGMSGKGAKPATRQPFRLEISTPGILDNLVFRAATREKPGPGEVEIQVCATALNFKDIAKVMGLLSDASLEGTASGRGIGLECAGRITAIGEGVEGFRMGDEVIAFAPHSFSSYTIADARSVMPKPTHLSFEEAATIPSVFMTAYYALHHLGKIRRDERVLIHSATGGVGLAAVQIAQWAGAEIFGTAGNPEKREFLRALGVQHVMDSRSLAFADEVMEHTDGLGVDIVLNSLAGEAIPKGLSTLGAYGRFIELGKRDIEQNSRLGLRPFQNNLSFFAVDMDRLFAERPDFAGSLLREVVEFFTDGTLHPLPHRVFPISEVASAFRYMAQAKHIGKIVVSMLGSEDVVVTPSSERTMTFRPDGTYLIIGGLGGFGLAVAQWLVEHGAHHLVLMGRSGASSSAARQAVEGMRKQGAEVVIAKADVTQEQQVSGVLADISRSMPPLRGVIHAAMVLDDGILLQLNQERFQKVMAPKAIGAWNLHTQTLNTPLDFFVSFSSFASLAGNPGQGNYGAANAFLDALAHYRHAHGLPALTINWGALGDVGHVAQNTDVGQHLERIGIKLLPSQQALKALGRLLRQEAVQTAVVSANWQRWAKTYASGASPRFSHLIGEAVLGQSEMDDEGRGGDSLRNSILAAEPEERRSLLEAVLREQVARVLGLGSVEHIEPRHKLFDLGLDSLMATELKNRLEVRLECSLRPTLVFDYPTVEALIDYLAQEVFPSESSPVSEVKESLKDDGAPVAASVELEQLSESDAEVLLLRELEKIEY